MPLPLLLMAGAGIAAAATMAGKAIGEAVQGGRDAEANDLLQKALEQYGPDILPKIGTELQNFNIPESKLAQLVGDAESIAMQRKVMGELEKYALSPATDKQATLELMQAQDAARGQFGRAQESILEQLRNSGQYGRLGVGAQQVAASQAANMANAQGMQAAALAEQRKMRALSELGGMSTTMRNQAFGERSQAAKAQDLLNQFNAQMAYNSKQQQYNAVDQDFRRKMGLANARSGVYGDMAGAKRNQGQREAGVARGIAGDIGNTAYNFAGAFGADMGEQQQAPGRRAQGVGDYWWMNDEENGGGRYA
jgi:hypothetical protein